MTKTFLRKFWIILISTVCIATVITLACAGDWGPEYGTSSFTPEVFVADAYSPFFYSDQFYYGIGHDESHITRWNKNNAAEWAAWLGKPTAEISYLLDTADITIIEKKLTNSTNKKTTAFLQYLLLAKKAEAFALTGISRWEADTTKKAPFNAANLDKQLLQGLTTATDPFLQERYWFQLLRSHFFNGTPQQTIKLFEDYRPKFPANKLWYRSLAYTAGAYCKLNQYGKANYYYSRVFDSCNELKTVAHYSFRPQQQADWNASLALCRNNEEKATLWQMVGIFYSDPDHAIDEIYHLDPHSEKLEVLLSRAVNIRENGKQDAATSALVTRIANAGNTSKPWIWTMAAGYLAMLDHQYKTAEAFYKKTNAPQEKLPQEQLRLLKMLNTIASAPTIDHALEQKLLADIQWLIAQQEHPDIRVEAALEWTKRTLAADYKKAGDKVKAECFVHESVFYTSNENTEALKAFLAKPGKTPYEQLCASLSTIRLPDIFEYQSAILTLADHIDEAINAIGQSPKAAAGVLPGNPFNARINDCHDCDHDAPQKIKYTKGSFLQKLKELKEKIAAGQDVYTNAVLLGNAQYNITHFGNDRFFYEGSVLGSGQSTPETVDSVLRPFITNMSMAVKYYTLALGAAQNNEQRAKCQYLLAKCQRNQWYMKNYDKVYRVYYYEGPMFTAFDGFKNLKQYANTNYYKEVIRECGYFNTYIRKNP